MLARLQQLICLAWLAALAAVVAHGVRVGWDVSHIAALVALLAGHAAVLALEFLMASALHRRATGHAIPARDLIGAWCREIVAAPLAFLWRQPWRSASPADHVDPFTARGRRGVVFVHGFVCNRGLWRPWLRRLRARGTPYVAVNLEPVFGSIDDYPPIIEDAVRRLEDATGRAPILVAHSMGGLAVRAWLHRHRSEQRVHAVITIGTPHAGTWLAGLSPGRRENVRQMRAGNPWLSEMAAGEPPERAARFTCWWSECDQIVMPVPTAVLPGSDARRLPGRGHVDIALADAVWHDLVARLHA